MAVNNTSAPNIDVYPVTQAIESVFRTLKPWFEAESDVSDFDDIIQCIRLQGRNYAVVVDLSVKTSEDGVILADKALVLCSEIEGGRDEKTIKDFFDGILLIAATAYERAEKCRDLFEKIRFNIARISTRVPKATKGSTKRLANVNSSLSRNDKAAYLFGIMAEAANDTATDIGTDPTYGLISPLAIVRFFARGAENMFMTNVEDCEREYKTLDAALAGLKQLEQDFKRIHSCLGDVVEWWRGVKEKLHDMEQKIRLSTYSDEAILNALRGGWGDVKGKYRRYQSKTMEIQDRYRSQFKTESQEMDIGFKGRLLELQRSVDALYNGLESLSTTRAGRNEKFRHSIHAMQRTFLAQLVTLLDCLRKFEKRTEDGVVTGILGYRRTMRKALQNLLNEGNTYSRNFSVELWIICRIVEKEHSRTARVLGTMKLRTSDSSTTAESVKQLGQIKEAIQSISNFGADLALNGPWQEDDTVVEKFQPFVNKAVREIEFAKEKLEEKLRETHPSGHTQPLLYA